MTYNLSSSQSSKYPPFTWQTLLELDLPRVLDCQREAVDRVYKAVQGSNLPVTHQAQFRSSLTRAIRHAVERSQETDPREILNLRVLLLETDLAGQKADPVGNESSREEFVDQVTQSENQQPSQGWGFFYIEKEVLDKDGAGKHLLELYLYS